MTHLDKQFIRYEKDINRFAKNKCNGRDEYKDLVQDAYLKMKRAEAKGSYNEQGKFKSWILMLTNSLYLDKFRSRKIVFNSSQLSIDKKYKNKDRGEGDLKSILVSELDSETEENETEHIFWLRFKKVYDELNPAFKEVMDLHTWEGMKHIQIAQKLDISVNTSLGRYRYGVINLQKEFNLI